MTNWQRVWATLSITFVLAGVTASVWADFKPKVALGTHGNTGSLDINGRRAVHFQTSNGQLSPLQRAQITADRLAALVNSKLDPNTLFVKGDKHSARIYAGDKLVCIATSSDAKLYRTTAVSLANDWVSKMKGLLLMPPIVLDDEEITIPIGENRLVDVGGAAEGPIYAKIDDDEVVGAAPEANSRRLCISAKKLGKAEVDISVEGQHATLVVFVKKYAGTIPGVSIGQVTGNPCPPELVCYAAKQAVAQNATLEPNASLEIGRAVCPSQSLPRGKNRQIKVDVRIFGPNYIPFSSHASAEVRNVTLPNEEPGQLFYSNNPENITKYQPLFAGKLDLNTPTRVLYHHQNMMSKRVHLIVELVNPNDSPAMIRVIRGCATPSVDTIIVGHVAGCAFLKDCAKDVSVIETIPPQSRLVV